MIKWLVMMALLAGCATPQGYASQQKVRVEEPGVGWHWYDYAFGIPLGILGFYDPGRTAD